MPLYCFRHPTEDAYIEINQRMVDVHEYFDEEGIKWLRVFTVPQASFVTKIDPFSKSQFVRSMQDKTDTVGETWEKSAEMSEKRAALNGGVDPVKEKYFKDYKKARKGARHLQDAPKKVETKDIVAEF